MAASEQAPRVIGRRYQVIREIGAGNMGSAFVKQLVRAGRKTDAAFSRTP